MSRYLRTYRITIFLGLLFFGTFIVDTILRFQNGTSFIDFLMGKHVTTGLYNYIWFKGSFIIKGELWRIFTWPFFFIGLLYFIFDFTILIMLLSRLERRLGTLQTALRILVVHLVYTSMLWLTRGIAYKTADIGFVSINPLLFALIGTYITERFIDGSVGSSIKSKLIEWLFIGYTVVNLISQMVTQSSGYVFLYALSIGILISFTFNFKKCCILNCRIPIYKKKFFYVTYSIIAISILIFILDLIFASGEIKAEIYKDFSFSKWINYFMYHTGDNNGAVSSWLCLNYEDLRNGQIWRMFTLVYSHYGFEHILFNMPAIFLAGRYIESKYGTIKTLLIFEGSAFFVSIYACLTSINRTFSGFGGSSLGIYAFLIVFMLMIYEKGQNSKPRWYELIYVVIYFILGNIPVTGVKGDNHLHSFLFGLIVFFTLNAYTKIKMRNGFNFKNKLIK